MKNKILKLAICSILLSLTFDGIAQNQGLQVGEKLPVKSVNHIFNYPSKVFDFNQAKGKILILDFWSTWCPSCISGLAKLNELQQKFPDKLLVVPVNYQSKQVIEKFWRTNPITQKIKLMTITDDKELSSLFPHKGLPLEVWFDQSGKYLGSTDLEWVNEIEINRLMNGNKPDWISRAIKKEHDFSKHLISTPEASKLLYFSALSPNIQDENIDAKIIEDSSVNTVNVTCINYNIRALYGLSLGDHPDLNDPKRIKIQVKDTARLRYYKTSGLLSLWNRSNTYCYELMYPLVDRKSSCAFLKMRSDLDAFFNYQSEIKTFKTDFYRLFKTGGSENLNGNERVKNSLATILDLLNSNENLPIIIADKNLNRNTKIYFDLNSMDDINSANKKFEVNGYKLVKVTEELAFFILTDRKAF